MKQVIPLITAIVILLAVKTTLADTFTVTTNSDTGTGSLRAAIEAANAHLDSNGVADNIVFNISGSDFTSRTIYLQSALPTLIRPVIIDGTTQPNVETFGKSDARIKLVDSSLNNKFTGLNIQAINCELYGLYLTGFSDGVIVQVSDANAKIGALTKGNLINSSQNSCLEIQFSNNVVVNGNLMGTDSIGRDGSNYSLPFSTYGVIINSCNLVSIGSKGIFAGSPAGNTISHCSVGIWMHQDKNIKVQNNNIGSSRAGWLAVPNSTGILADGDNSYIAIGGDTLTEGNTISGNFQDGIEGEFRYSYFKGNHIGVDGSGQNSQSNHRYGIYLKNGSVWNQIGDNSLEGANIIAYNSNEGIALQNSSCTNNSIRINSMICNSAQTGIGGIVLNRGNDSIDVPDILITNSKGMTGRTVPGAVVDFYTDDGGACPHCEGKTWIASIPTDSAGVFFLSGDYRDDRVTATVTDPQGNSSEFTNCSTRSDSSTCISTVLLGPTTPQCTGTSINFYDQSVVLPGTFILKRIWNFGDGTTSSEAAPIHSYTTGNTTYTVELFDSTSAGCTSSEEIPVSLNYSPQAAFSAPTLACSNVNISFANTSSGGTGDSIVHTFWDFGDTFTDTTANPTHAFIDTGSFVISLTVTNSRGCSSSTSQGIAISLAPVPSYQYTFIDSCTASFTNTSTMGKHASFFWNFGDGSPNDSSTLNPVHRFIKSGTLRVTLTIYDTACNVTKIYFLPIIVDATSCTTGIAEVKNSKDVKIIPNPAGSSFNIQNNMQQPIQSVELYDVIGKLVYQIPSTNIRPNTSYRVQLPLLPNGVYTVRMKTSDSFVNVKVVESR